jgi:hypothetical protein
MVTIDLDHFGVTVWVDGVVGKSENIKWQQSIKSSVLLKPIESLGAPPHTH